MDADTLAEGRRLSNALATRVNIEAFDRWLGKHGPALLAAAEERDRLREANEAFLAEYQERLLSAATVANRHAARLAALSEKEDR